MFDNSIHVVPLFGQFWVKTKATWEDKDKSSEIAAPQSTLIQTALHSQWLRDLRYNTRIIVSPTSIIEFLHNKIKCELTGQYTSAAVRKTSVVRLNVRAKLQPAI